MDRSSWGFAENRPELARFGAQVGETGRRVRSPRPSPALFRRLSAPLPPLASRRRCGVRRPGLVGSEGDPEGCAGRRGTRWPRKGSRGRPRRSSGAGPLRATLFVPPRFWGAARKLAAPAARGTFDGMRRFGRELPPVRLQVKHGTAYSRACRSPRVLLPGVQRHRLADVAATVVHVGVDAAELAGGVEAWDGLAIEVEHLA